MSVSRRRFLSLFGIAPAVPILSKILPTESPLPASAKAVSMSEMVVPVGPVTGGWCAPIAPLYDLPADFGSHLVRDSLPTVRPRR